MHEIPVLALAEREHVAEQLLGLGAVEEVLLVRRALIGIARRHGNADAEFRREVEELGDLLRRVPVEDGGIDVDREALGLGGLDRRDRAIERALLRDGLVVMVFQTVQMHREKQIWRRFEQVELLFQQQRVGAQRHEFLPRHQTADDFADFLVDQRLAAGDRHHRRAAFVGGIPAFLRRHAAVRGLRRDSRSCRSRRRRGCNGTAARASAPADNAFGQASSA